MKNGKNLSNKKYESFFQLLLFIKPIEIGNRQNLKHKYC